MPSITIKPISTPSTGMAVEEKKQILQNVKSASARSTSKPDAWPVDTVTLSSEQTGDSNLFTGLKPSPPVTYEEKQALMSTFSRHA